MRPLNWGIPTRMARVLYDVFQRDGQEAHEPKIDVIDRLLCDDKRIPLATADGVITGWNAVWRAADEAVRDVWALVHRLGDRSLIRAAIEEECGKRGVRAFGDEDTPDGDVIARAVDAPWWRRVLWREWLRRFEHTAIQLGLTHVRTGDPYVSRETAVMQERRNRENQALLEQRTATNEHGQTFTVAELAALGVANKAIRRGELMTRIRGFEEVADHLRDVGMFWTITCPSRFHSVGGTNPNYNGATPREGQAYLCDVWKRIRAALHRKGIRPYGFRIAEPHTDGCPHWHMLLFVKRDHAEAMEAVVRAHALKDSGDEPGAQDNRVKLVRIEAGKGTAAGYIAKYVSKNIDGAGVGDHKTFEDGRTYVLVPDVLGDLELTPSARVTYWSQVWGIRQFQQIGGAPVGVWRELRRIKADTVQNAPDAIKAAHLACQKIESDDPAVAKQASFAAYLWAQGGPTCGRQAAIRLATQTITVEGRYATYDAPKPVGVYAAIQPDAVYESVRFRWTLDGGDRKAPAVAGAPWTGVNNCTPTGRRAPWTDPANAPELHPKRYAREAWRPSENRGDGKPGSGWSARGDKDRASRFKRVSPRHAGSHLDYLRRKYDD